MADDKVDLSFTTDPAYREKCERLLAHIVAEGPKDWWYKSEGEMAVVFDEWIDEHGTDPDTLTLLTAMWLAWNRAQGYAVVKPFPLGPQPGTN